MTISILEQADLVRHAASSNTTRQKKAELGQFFTPSSVAEFMASLFPASKQKVCHLLDAGAGTGSLTSAFINRIIKGELKFLKIKVTAYEIDDAVRAPLTTSLKSHQKSTPLTFQIESRDFIEHGVSQLRNKDLPLYTHVILNPPYKKINSESIHRKLLSQAEIETVNLYSGFVALSLELMNIGGYLVAIIPRSFCNGPYYQSFRELILKKSAIRHIHLFDSRNNAFKDDNVLQENIVIALERGGSHGSVCVSRSTDASFSDLSCHQYSFDRIVDINSIEKFIHIPTSINKSLIETSELISSTLEELDLTVSTGPIVDFRVREHLRQNFGKQTVPLLYPSHFLNQNSIWPIKNSKKPNAIAQNDATIKWLYPNGFYTVVRRFSTKEEQRRIIPSLVNPKHFPGVKLLGLENHLNVYHRNKSGLPENLARGLSIYLSTTIIDDYFRQFNGHTQVNATDLRLMPYPSTSILEKLGKWAKNQDTLTQKMIDHQFNRFTK